MRWRRLILAKTRPAHDWLSGVQKPKSDCLHRLQEKLAQADPVRDRLPKSAQVFCVGGAVRDALLGEPSTDLDFVVVGARIDDMLAAGFTPVGKDFPVFLHPQSHDEYALARTERKSGKGYKGFVFNADPSVTLEDDLSRRDLTINAIAMDRDGRLIDPHGGGNDLQTATLRHIGSAFSEDPVRLLRLARFAARWPHFSVAQATMDLCRQMVANNEIDALVPERVWQELSKGLMESQPSRMMDVLTTCGAWPRLHPQIQKIQAKTLAALDHCATGGLSLEGRYALLVHNLGGNPQPIHLFKASTDCTEMADLLERQYASLPNALKSLAAASDVDPEPLLQWLMSCDITRRIERYETLLSCLEMEGAVTKDEHIQLQHLAHSLLGDKASKQVADAASQAQQSGQAVADAVRAARLLRLREALRGKA